MLTNCPICNYSLTGLPDQHRCPECGYDYDRDSRMVDLSLPFQRFLPYVYGALAIWGAYLLWQQGIGMALIMGSLFPAAMIFGHYWQKRGTTLLTTTDIQFIRDRKVLWRCPLDNAVSAYSSPYDGHVSLHDTEGRELRRLPDALRWTVPQTKKLAAAINARFKARGLQP